MIGSTISQNENKKKCDNFQQRRTPVRQAQCTVHFPIYEVNSICGRGDFSMTEPVNGATLTTIRLLLRTSHPFFFYNPSGLPC